MSASTSPPPNPSITDRSSAVRYAQIGGGPDAFIGAVHRMAARLDGNCELVAGAFSSSTDRSRETGHQLGLDSSRVSGNWQELLEREARLKPSERAEFINIVTPNHLHAPMATAAIELGFHVLCDKPLCHSAAEGEALAQQLSTARSHVDAAAPLFGVTYNYSGYPMVREARQRVLSGAIGVVRSVVVEYNQGWLAEQIEQHAQKQASWRTDPARAGAGGAMGDIGSHAAHLAEFVLGEHIQRVCADLGTSFKDRVLDDHGSVFLRFVGGLRGLLSVTQVAVGRENGLRLRVWGETGSLEWSQEEPNSLQVDALDQPRQTFRAGGPGLSAEALDASRLPPGHPEGFVEAFANLYSDFADAVARRRDNPQALPRWTPTLNDGLRGVRFIEAVVASSRSEQSWVDC